MRIVRTRIRPVKFLPAALLAGFLLAAAVSSRQEPEPSAPAPVFAAVSAPDDGFPSPIPKAEEHPVSEDIPLSGELQQFAQSACARTGVPYGLLLAVIAHESGFDPDAVHHNANGTADSGLMQLNDVVRPYAKARFGSDDLLDPKQNITVGTAILADYLGKYPLPDAVTTYALGEAGMKRAKREGRVCRPAEEILALAREYAE